MPIVDFRIEVSGRFEFDWEDYDVPEDECTEEVAREIAEQEGSRFEYWLDEDFYIENVQL